VLKSKKLSFQVFGMEFKIGAEVLSSYVNTVSKVVNAKANLPLLNNILIDVQSDKLRLTGSDLEIQITTQLQLKALEPGTISVNAKLFSQYLNSIPKDATLTVSQNKGLLKVSSSVGAAEFATREAEDFPLFEDGEMEQLFLMPATEFASMVDMTLFACAKDDIRPILTGVNIEIDNDAVQMVALDTFRLAKITGKSQVAYSGKKQLVIPAAAMDNMVRITKDSFLSSVTDQSVVNCELSKAGNFVLLSYGDVKLYARLLDGEYPAYKAIIPVAHQTEVSLTRSVFLESIKRVGVFAQSAIGQKVVLTFGEGKVVLESQVPEIGNITEEFTATIDGEPLKIAFQIKFLTDILALLTDEVVLFRATSKVAPGVFMQPSLETFLHILMPLKLDD
jgi:DNA polymerase-3 subunit beta